MKNTDTPRSYENMTPIMMGWHLTEMTPTEDASSIERDLILAREAISKAVSRFGDIVWGWDGDCGSAEIMSELEDYLENAGGMARELATQDSDNSNDIDG